MSSRVIETYWEMTSKNDSSKISLLKSELYDVMKHSVNPDIHSIFKEQPYLPVSDYAGLLDIEELGFLYDDVRQFEDRYRGRYAIYCFGSKRAKDSQYKRFRHKMYQEA